METLLPEPDCFESLFTIHVALETDHGSVSSGPFSMQVSR